MEEKLYSIEEVANILKVHHKTVRRYVTNGNLKANKVGKQWRISGHDLSTFLESSNIDINKNTETKSLDYSTDNNIKLDKVSVSTVVDINNINTEDYSRISNTLLAVMNTRDVQSKNATINMKYTEKEENLKVLLWGDIDFIKGMLELISIFMEN